MTTTTSQPESKQTEPSFIFTRVLNAPRALVFKAWTDPSHLAQWWGPLGFTNPVCELDVRPGGAIRIDMKGPEGTVYPMTGTFREIVEPERLVFTSSAMDEKNQPLFEVENIVTFTEDTGKTTVVVRASASKLTAEAAQYLAGMEEGWSQTLDQLCEHLSKKNGPLVIERTFHAPVAKVWKAITTKEDFDHWYFDLEEFKPEVGFEFQFSVEHEGTVYDHRCKVTEVIPERKLAYSWRFEGHEGNSLVTFELFAQNDHTTRLRLTHEGLETFPKMPSYARANFTRGWTTLVGQNLKRFVETL